jgi:hypothetical protein
MENTLVVTIPLREGPLGGKQLILDGLIINSIDLLYTLQPACYIVSHATYNVNPLGEPITS